MNYHRDKDYLRFEKTFRNIFRLRFNFLSHLVGGTRVVLDIGCANGVFLDLFKEKGWQTWGVEPSGTADRAQRKGHRVINTNFEGAKLPENYFDLIIFNHTLEHMTDPPTVLAKVYRLLKATGVLFVDAPNAGGLGARILGKHWPYLLPKEHKWQFTKEGLTKLLHKAGFEVIHWQSRSGIFEYANPFLELYRKRFLLDLFAIPYSLSATLLGMGDSMSFIAQKT